MLHPDNPERWLDGEETRAYRQMLFDKQGGLCYHCKNRMRLIQPCPPEHNTGDVATFEHLKDRLSPGGRKGDGGTIVVACSSCNNKRNSERTAVVIAALKAHFGEEHHRIKRGKSITEMIEMLKAVGINPLGDEE